MRMTSGEGLDAEGCDIVLYDMHFSDNSFPVGGDLDVVVIVV